MATKKVKEPIIFKADLLALDPENGNLLKFGLMYMRFPKNLNGLDDVLNYFHSEKLLVVFGVKDFRTSEFLDIFGWEKKRTKFKDKEIDLYYEPGTPESMKR